MVKVKICGITNLDDALTAIDAGADALGFVFVQASPRHIAPEQAADIIRQLPPFVHTVGLFVNQTQQTVNSIADQCGLDLIQLHGDESPHYCRGIGRRIIKAFRIKDSTSLDGVDSYRVAACLLDAWSPTAHGGTGQTFNWDIAAVAAAAHRIILAGGLTPANVAEAVKRVCPYAVDVSSGVESAPGRKDAALVRDFIAAAKHASAGRQAASPASLPGLHAR
ncbi:phosphoribosylanthranilate isomerase [Geobacter sp. SVR]|uniref:phosphoribosylanthranilate isomerase n=1 Tax=Geobacter sp. SVR TaxID=2495594 RepID=UPI00143EF4DD|nr:phosphoribosylanthranilate isomerase [Geobacter sp. SVR]BCS52965.1 N-(5'-phosphoribosyl)anthranilate isomerase [Geobacter sp. SVR]GCF84349.1 N-(5'-phosphoribosyl)anthranilate isomerase [Geobacter sp. SVR]